jgi:hypothetical protein
MQSDMEVFSLKGSWDLNVLFLLSFVLVSGMKRICFPFLSVDRAATCHSSPKFKPEMIPVICYLMK